MICLLYYLLVHFVVFKFTPMWLCHWLSPITHCFKFTPAVLLVFPPSHPLASLPAVSRILQTLVFIFDFQFREMFATDTHIFSKFICWHFDPECDDIWRQGPHEAELSWWDSCPYKKRYEKKKNLTFFLSLPYKCYGGNSSLLWTLLATTSETYISRIVWSQCPHLVNEMLS